MARENRENQYRDDRRDTRPPKKKSAFGTFLITLLLVIAVGVFAFSGYKLWSYYQEYKVGTDEYGSLNDNYLKTDPNVSGTQGQDAQDGQDTQTGQDPAAAPAALTDVAALEDPETLQAIIDAAPKQEVMENNEEKQLPTLKNPVDFAELRSVNPDIVGWIRVGAVNISYPIAQGKDNDYYLHRTFKGVDNFAGCIFENAYNSPYFTDQNTIIYGHNMKNGSMFAPLKEFSKQETVDRNPYFWIFTPTFIFQYRIFSSSIVSKIGDPYITRFSQEDFQKFIDKSIASSEINCGDVKVTTDDRVVTLSTCTGNDATRRILQGVLVQVYLSE